MSSFIGLERIKENSDPTEIQTVCQTLIKIIDNIIEDPNDSARRCIKLDSDEVSSKLMPYSGGLESLFEIGFEEADDCLILPSSVEAGLIKRLRDELDSIRNPNDVSVSGIKLTVNENVPSTPVGQSSRASIQISNPVPMEQNSEFTPVMQQCKTTLGHQNQAAPAVQRVMKRSLAAKNSNRKFGDKLQRTYDHVLLYELPQLKEKARNCMPIERFNTDALSKYNAYKSGMKVVEKCPYQLRDFLFLELMAWFKNEFFKWVNQPECDHCSSNANMVFKYNAGASSSENIWMAGSVEVYECRICCKSTRFPRYNHPEKLLETRRGRCGEWANCFTLLLRSLDFDARYVLDWTDHVWCEFYSVSQQRWLHADPCENIMDKPLIYEHGWGKKLSYVIAFSYYQCMDVTWRYTSQFKEVIERRNECSETWLVRFANKLSTKRQVQFEMSKRKEIEMRTVTEVVEFLTPKKVKDGEDVGRESGSLQWRITRGEIQIPEVQTGFSFKSQESDITSFRVQYNSVSDKYVTSDSTSKSCEIKGWKNGASNFQNMQLKVENDWKMAYLARTDGSDSAFMEWSFDLSNLKLNANKIDLKLQSECFENGNITWSIHWSSKVNDYNNLNHVVLSGDSGRDNLPFKVTDRKGGWTISEITDKQLVAFKVVAKLSGGSGQNAWQHTQLFRQSLNEAQNLFDVCFYF